MHRDASPWTYPCLGDHQTLQSDSTFLSPSTLEMEGLMTLEEVRTRVWRRMTTAAEEPGHAFRTLAFGTVQDNQPHLRTVTLRSVESEAHRLAFHSDRRAQKIDHLRSNGRVAWLGWDPETREQVRLRGAASVHVNDSVAESMWEAEDSSSLGVYAQFHTSRHFHSSSTSRGGLCQFVCVRCPRRRCRRVATLCGGSNGDQHLRVVASAAEEPSPSSF